MVLAGPLRDCRKCHHIVLKDSLPTEGQDPGGNEVLPGPQAGEESCSHMLHGRSVPLPRNIFACIFCVTAIARKCKYTNFDKFLVEVEDKVDDESLESLRIAEELQAAAGELPNDFQGFSLHMSESLGLEDQPGSKAEEAKTKLESFPAIELNRLAERVKKYKDHALGRKSKYNTAADRLREEGATGHEILICNGEHAFIMSLGVNGTSYKPCVASQSYNLSSGKISRNSRRA